MGKSSGADSPPPASYNTFAQVQAMMALEEATAAAYVSQQTTQLQFMKLFMELQQSMTESLTTVPAVTETEEIDWTDTIAAFEAEAYAEIIAMAPEGPSSGTVITSPLLWETEAAVVSPLLSGY